MFKQLTEIFKINCESDFNELALKVFKYQFDHNIIYQKWVKQFYRSEKEINSVDKIPFIPIEFFKSHKVVSFESDSYDKVFLSSATTQQIPSQHFVKELAIYEESFIKGFQQFFGDPDEYCILALLPGYLERTGSSLVYMCEKLIAQSKHVDSGFYLRDLEALAGIVEKLKAENKKTILIGVSYALLDFADLGITLGENFIVMETGGMKGTRKEVLKEELHAILKQKFSIPQIASEYGMTEMLSQAYALQDGVFKSPAWLRFLIRDINDPQAFMPAGKTGGINVIDLANVYSCSFIATKDLGILDDQGNLILRGRYDLSDMRGCNLMIS